MQENEIFIFYTVCSKFKYASFLFRLEQQLNIIIPIQSSARKKLSHFDLKIWIPGGTKIRPEIPSNWRIFESNWPDVEIQFDSNVLQLLGISGQILVCQFDSQNRVNLNQIFSNYSEFRVKFYFRQWLKLLGQNGSFFFIVHCKTLFCFSIWMHLVNWFWESRGGCPPIFFGLVMPSPAIWEQFPLIIPLNSRE